MSKSTITPKKPLKQQREDWKPHSYQKKAIKAGLQNACFGYLLDPGLGKTSIFLALIKILKKEKMVQKTLLIAPLRVCHSVWPKELAKWKDFKDISYVILHGKDKEKNLEKDVDLYIINPEGIDWLLTHNIRKLGFQMLGVDESSKFKNTQSKRFKMLRPYLPMFNRRVIMTGSFAPNGLMDMFGQMYICDCGEALGQYITHFRNKYFYPSGYGGYDWKIQEGAEEKIQARVKPSTLRLDAEDHLKLPKLITDRIEITLPKKARKIYKEMEDELIAFLKDGDITAVNAAVASGKLSQIANGGIYDEDRKVHKIHMEKAEAVAERIEGLNGNPALVAYEFQHDLERLRKVLGKNIPFIGGGVSTKRALELEDEWNAGNLPALFVQPASVAHGLNLQKSGNRIIIHSIIWNFEEYDQLIRRIRRQGSTHSQVFVDHVVALDTIDEVKLFALERKNATQKGLYAALNEFYGKKKLPKR